MFKQKPGNLSDLNINWKKYSKFFKRIHVDNKKKLLVEGEISDQIFILEKGCVRLGFEKNKKDITMFFFFEDDLATSFESFYGMVPSKYFIETLEPCIVHCLKKTDLEYLLANEPEVSKMSYSIVISKLTHYLNHLDQHLSHSPEERFVNLIENNPSVFMRAPQRHIASYLGITTVSLSRIKARKMNKVIRPKKEDLGLS